MTRLQRRLQGNGQDAPSAQSPMKIPLNDDAREKAARLHSRQAFKELSLNNLRVVSSGSNMMTPSKGRRSIGPNQASPHTPQRNSHRSSQNDNSPRLNVVGALTPMKRVPILANFEEWMKIATDNKIKKENSWDFALIDYFHDLSLLKEGDGVNFQKASCTLDGCVKIYTSRVDSVADETTRLLSGLAEGSSEKKEKVAKDGEEDEDDEDGEEGGAKKKTRRKARTAESTLVNSFEQLRLKKFELEFSVDPLFKKMSADFDEGGAKGLLLNHLSLDKTGRIVFDSSEDAVTAEEQPQDLRAQEEAVLDEEGDVTMTDAEPIHEPLPSIDIASLGAKYFPDLSVLDSQDICPSLKTFALGDSSASLDELPFLRPHSAESENDTALFPDGDDAGADLNMGGFDVIQPDDDDDDDQLLPAFGDGGEAWVQNAHLEPVQHRIALLDDGVEPDADGEDLEAETGGHLGITMQHPPSFNSPNPTSTAASILSYFDAHPPTSSSTWAGPEHWRIRRLKTSSFTTTATTPAPRKRGEKKEPFEIDFLAPLSQAQAELIYTPCTSTSVINLPRSQWRSKNRNLLPDDKHFNSRDLLRLALKPRAMIGGQGGIGFASRRRKAGGATAHVGVDGRPDEAYWATQQQHSPLDDDEARPGDYDADFFADGALDHDGPDVDDGDEPQFSDARDHFSPPPADMPETAGTQSLGAVMGTQGVIVNSQLGGLYAGGMLPGQGRRKEFMRYARVSKKVDVKRLKDAMWAGLLERKVEEVPAAYVEEESEKRKSILPTPELTPEPEEQKVQEVVKEEQGEGLEGIKFTTLMQDLKHRYDKASYADISTSYGFICLLHLCNEQGLQLQGNGELTEISVRRDGRVIEEVGA